MTNPFAKEIVKDAVEQNQKAKEVVKKVMGEKLPENKLLRFKQKKPDLEEPKQFEENEGKDKTPAKGRVITEKPRINWNRALLYFTVLAIIGIIFLYQMVDSFNSGLALLLWLFGMMCFFPLGLILGWFFLDPYMRCKIARRMRGKNYGIVHFVHPAGKRITTRVKNLDDDVIVQGTKLWILKEEAIFYLNVDNELIKHAEIDSDNIMTLPANIPSIYLDSRTMIPLSFGKEQSKTNPQEAGAILLGFINNQIAKNLFFKRQMTMFYIVVIALAGITFAICTQIYMDMQEMVELIPQLQDKINQLSDLISTLNPP
jgi:hypothetical protein